MTNHVHLLITPSTKDSSPQIMQSIGRRYVQYINNTYQRTGTLWERRYKASLVDAEHYLLACYKYIELNPVRAKMVEHPADHPWSSYAVNSGIKTRQQLKMHDVYKCLGVDHNTRCHAYKELFSMPLGNNKFKQQIEEVLKRKIGEAKLGRLKNKK